jgi:hypothetical protein
VSHRVVEIIARNSLKIPKLLKENRETEKIIPFPHFRPKNHRELPRRASKTRKPKKHQTVPTQVSRFNKFPGISVEKLSARLFDLQRIHFPANFTPTCPKPKKLPALLISSSCFTKIGETRTLITEVFQFCWPVKSGEF